jgi:acetyl esterase/lipase
MDVYRPPAPNGIGVVWIPGSGFHTPLGYDAGPITRYTEPYVPALTRAGYTVFVINHRSAPRFRHPSALEDAQRAVRFVRHHAARFAIASD